MKLSVILITKNAEADLADAIESVKKISDEVIVIDNGSTDRTRDIAEYMKVKVVGVEGQDFSQLRNKGLKEAKGEWVLYIDADERLSEALASEISNLKSSAKGGSASGGQISNQYDAFFIKRKNFYFGKHEWPYIEHLERLFKKSSLRGWRGKLHESPIIVGSVGEIEGFLLHYTHKDLSSMVTKTLEWSKIEAQLRFDAGHPKMSWWRFFRVMITAFLDSYAKQGGWRVGTVGIIESLYQAFSMFITYARLWEMQQEKLKTQSSNVKSKT